MPIPYELDLPAAPEYATLVDGEKLLSVSAALGGATARTTYYMSAYLSLPPGRYAMKIVADDAVTVWVGRGRDSMRMVFSSEFDDGAVVGEFQIFDKEYQVDFVMQNMNTVADTCGVAFSVRRDGVLVYTSSADGWNFETTPGMSIAPPSDTYLRLRLPVFSVPPNWQEGITERLSFLTDVMDSEEAFEQRRQMRLFPRRSFEIAFLRRRSHRARIDAFFTGVGGKYFLLPLWHEQYRLTDDIVAEALTGVSLPAEDVLLREFRNDQLVLVTAGDPDVFDVAVIESINETGDITWSVAPKRDWSAGARIVPLRKARMLEQPQLDNLTDHVGSVRARFEVENNNTYSYVVTIPETSSTKWVFSEGGSIGSEPYEPDTYAETAQGACTMGLPIFNERYPGSDVTLGVAEDVTETTGACAMYRNGVESFENWGGTLLLLTKLVVEESTDEVVEEAMPVPSWGYCVPFFWMTPDWSQPVTVNYDRKDFRFDNETGEPLVSDLSDQARQGQRLSMKLFGREKVWAFRSFIAQAAGRAQRFYMPSFTADLQAVEIDAGTLIAKPTSYWENMRVSQQSKQWIAVVFKDGLPPLFRKIASVEPVDLTGPPYQMTGERFTFTKAMPPLNLADIRRIQFVSPARFDQDTFELHHHVDDSAAVSVASSLAWSMVKACSTWTTAS
jgi:hypothetical protein